MPSSEAKMERNLPLVKDPQKIFSLCETKTPPGGARSVSDGSVFQIYAKPSESTGD